MSTSCSSDPPAAAGSVTRSVVDAQTERLQVYMLKRLARLAGLRASLEPAHEHRRLVDKALYSTYRDCVGLGCRVEAQLLLGLAKS